jgi:taurine dioxygenase
MSNIVTLPNGKEEVLSIHPIAGHIGAKIKGADLTRPLLDEDVATIRAALLKYKVLVIRGQHIDHGQQIAFTRRFGKVTPSHPYDDEAPTEFPEVLVVDNQKLARRSGGKRPPNFESRSGWHTDITAAVNPPAITFLRAGDVPDQGGDTTFTNLAAAYAGLPEILKPFLETLRAEHQFGGSRPEWANRENTYLSEKRASKPFLSEHSVVRAHPETGEKILFVNPGFTSRIVGLGPSQSARILDILFDAVTDPAYTVRFRWTTGTLVFWDNRATAHLAPTDIDPAVVHRVLYRTTIAGDVPVGVDGRRSISLLGDPFLAIAAE